MMNDTVFVVAKEFGPFAGPRYKHQGPYSGETLRPKLLAALDRIRGMPGVVIVDLDGMKGIGSSFLDEAFGGLIRSEGVEKDEINARFDYRSRVDPSYIETIRDSIERARRV